MMYRLLMAGIAAMLLSACADRADLPTPAPASYAFVTLAGDTVLLADGRAVKLADLPEALRDLNLEPGARVMVRTERDVVYGDVMRVMDVLQRSGFKAAFVAEEKVD
jgi:biopolymer transport protein ExbD